VNTIIQMWEGIPLQLNEQIAQLFPHCGFDDFPDNCCGAGQGIWEKLVPDYIYISPVIIRDANPTMVKISPACAGHDLDWNLSKPTWDDFHEANSRLYANIKAIVENKTEAGSNTQYYALRYPAIYAHAVNTLGQKHFWKIKQSQGYQIPDSAAWLL